ncbi:hypothetical protein [Paenibacillus sp. FSL L8-0708]|uniref:hypothetical protein n=1 Tax=Paenibacillus sp. FSL L8-0708 TaxID=2975311 RepID=UPI0030FC8B94
MTKEQRESLIKALKDGGSTLRPSRICGTIDSLTLEGGKLPAGFNVDRGLYVWGRASRHSGASMTVTDLVLTEAIIRAWVTEQTKEAA